MNILTASALILSSSIVLSLSACTHTDNDQSSGYAAEPIVLFGKKLFHDKDLSKDGTQSCASCHDSKHAFIDPRVNLTSVDSITPGAVSLGQDDTSLGDINTPSITYSAFIPDFHFDSEEGLFKGGLFLNGRAHNLEKQAEQPLLNPVEMQNTKEAVVATVKTKYSATMQSIFGTDIFDSTETAFEAIATSIAAFEKTPLFASFDSKFDKVLRGEASFTAQEQLGHDLFIAEDKGNCAACHPVPELSFSKQESLFTDFSYDNLGAPKNERVRSQNGKAADFVDNGLFDNPNVSDENLKGAFRVPSLRNIAVTAPYMHNGVFRDLETVVEFYNSRDVADAINPETGENWAAAEVDSTKNTEESGNLGLSPEEVTAIVTFMKTLTDERYEHLNP